MVKKGGKGKKEKTKTKKCPGFRGNKCDSQIKISEEMCTNCRGTKFELDVEELFRLMGYHTKHNIMIDGNQIDVWAEMKVGAGTKPVLCVVECKSGKEKVKMDEIKKFTNVFDDLRRNKGITQGFIIYKHHFPPAGKTLAENRGIEVLSYNGLLSRLINFQPYCERFVNEFENYGDYVDEYRRPKCDLLIDIMARCDLYNYYVPMGIKEEEEKKTRKGFESKMVIHDLVDDFLTKWLKDEKMNHLTILGDFGTGKSSVSLYFAYHTAKHYLEKPDDPKRRIPLFISLRDYARVGKIEDIISGFLANKAEVSNASYALFRRMLDQGRLIMILDGFDEMAARGSAKELVRNFDALKELVHPRTKTLLTCRTNYFHDLEQEYLTLKGRKPTDPELEPLLRQYAPPRPYFQISELIPFNDDQIRLMFDKHGCDVEDCMVKLEQFPSLRDLASRPILIDMIIYSFDEISKEGKDIKLIDLYKKYTDAWIEREDPKYPDSMTKEGKTLLMEELAWTMFTKSEDMEEQSLHWTQIPDYIKKFFKELDFVTLTTPLLKIFPLRAIFLLQ